MRERCNECEIGSRNMCRHERTVAKGRLRVPMGCHNDFRLPQPLKAPLLGLAFTNHQDNAIAVLNALGAKVVPNAQYPYFDLEL